MPDLDVVILAAGKGTRMRSDIPKVLHPLAGQPLLAHVISTARSLDARRIVVVYGHGGSTVPDQFTGPDIEFVLQEPQLGTGHAVQQAIPHVDADTTLVLYGDVPLIGNRTLERLTTTGKDLAILTLELDDPHGYGRIVRDGSGNVTGIVEERDASEEQKSIREINTGLLAVSTQRLKDWLSQISNDNEQTEYYLTDIAALAVGDSASVVTVSPDNYFEVLGVNSKGQLARLERIFQWELAQGLMQQGVTVIDPARIDVRGTLKCGRDVTIDVGCVFEGNVELGDGVSIAPNCIIRDTKVGTDTEVLAFSHVEDTIMGARCRIGPYARLRPGNQLADEVRIGNFVEVKATQIGNGSKANHLAYLGDTSIGTKVNVGAGTITCNYDGANKYRTTIEDDVFIGSDTQLVAPVTVGAGATIGAGSTITRDAPPGELTVSRSKQLTVPGWQRPVKGKRK